MDRIVGQRDHHDAVLDAGVEKAGTAPQGSHPRPAGQADTDVEALIVSLAALVKGNTEEEVEFVSGEASTREVGLNVRLEIGWEWTSENLKGAPVIQGSVRLANRDEVEAYLQDACSGDCRDPARSARMLAAIRKEPAAAFLEWPDTWTIGSLPHAAHFVARCTECSATGKVRCLAGCRDGGNPCHWCKSTGIADCSVCGGHRGAYVDGYFKNCTTCRGSGRHGRCGSCNSTGTITCIYCAGQGKVECSACAGTATRTKAYSTSLVGHLSRSVAFDPALPDAFRRACASLSWADLVSEGCIDRVDGTCGPATVDAVLRLQVRHVNARVRCGQVGIEVDAVGKSRRVPLMPEFLDVMLAEFAETIMRLSQRDPSACLKEAGTTRLGRDLLAAVARGEKTDLEATSRRWSRAASPAFLSRVQDGFLTAYSRAARTTVRNSWLGATIWLVAAAVLANIYRLPGALGLAAKSLHPAALSGLGAAAAALACELVVLSPVLLGVWFLAGLRGRRALATALGSSARRRPRQGFWPYAASVVTVTLGLATCWIGLDAAQLGLPLAFGPDAHGRPLARAASDFIPAFTLTSGEATARQANTQVLGRALNPSQARTPGPIR